MGSSAANGGELHCSLNGGIMTSLNSEPGQEGGDSPLPLIVNYQHWRCQDPMTHRGALASHFPGDNAAMRLSVSQSPREHVLL